MTGELLEWLDALVLLRPWWLLALPGAVLAGWAWRRRMSRASPWHDVVDPSLQAHVLERPPGGGAGVPWRWIAIYVLAVLALAGPAWQEVDQPVVQARDPLMVALDLSSATRAADLAPDRATRARLKLARLLEVRQGGQLGLLAFAGSAHVVSPLTRDARTLRRLVDALEPGLMPVDGHRVDLAIERAVALMQGAGEASGAILVMTDGADPAAVSAARRAREAGFTVHVMGLGTPDGAPVRAPSGGFTRDTTDRLRMARLEPEALERLATAGGGRYTAIRVDDADLESLGVLQPGTSGDAGAAAGHRLQRRDAGFWLVLPMLLLLLPEFRRGGLMALTGLLVLAPVAPASATDIAALFKRDDQRAWEALVDGEPERAMQLARDPALRGAAAFRHGELETAIEAFDAAGGVLGLYNRGNALAAAGRYQEALESWRQTLELDPAHEDAGANIEALEHWLEQQPPTPESDDGEPGDGDGEPDAEPGSPSDGAGDEAPGREPDDVAGEPGPGEGEPGGEDDDTQSGSQPGENEAGEAPGTYPGPVDPADRAAAEQAVREAIEEALQANGEEGGPEGADADALDPEVLAEREQAEAIERWLRLVDDDPGALLRRKFMIEHQRRERMGGQ